MHPPRFNLFTGFEIVAGLIMAAISAALMALCYLITVMILSWVVYGLAEHHHLSDRVIEIIACLALFGWGWVAARAAMASQPYEAGLVGLLWSVICGFIAPLVVVMFVLTSTLNALSGQMSGTVGQSLNATLVALPGWLTHGTLISTLIFAGAGIGSVAAYLRTRSRYDGDGTQPDPRGAMAE